MKSINTLLLAIGCILCSIALWADQLPTTGKWGDSGLRSSVPAAPEASIDGNTISIYFQDELADLTVYIMDNSGTVYQTVISSNGSDYTCDLPWIGQPGNYQILMVHGYYGYQGGSFAIE